MYLPRRPMPPMNQYQMNPFGFQPPQQMNSQKRGLGGLLQRLLPNSSSRRGMQGMQGMQSFMNPSSMQRMNPSMFQAMNPSTLQNIANPSNLSAILGNVQKTLNAAEKVVPLVQQYGPLVKNIPAMWKIYRELKNSGNDEQEEKSDINAEILETKPENETPKAKEQTKKRKTGESVPKLYI